MLSAQPPKPSIPPGPPTAPELADPGSSLGQTSGAAVVTGGLWSILGRTLPQVQLLVLSVVAARFLGPDGMGRQSLIAFVGITTVMVATAGFPSSVSRFVGELLGARKGGVALGLYRWTWRVETIAAAIAAASLVALGLFGSEPALAWVLVGAASGLAVLQSVPQALLSGAQRWRAATIVGVVIGIATVPATIAVLALGGGISGLFAVEVVAVAINLAWTSHLARGVAAQLPAPEQASPELRRRFLGFAAMSTVNVMIQYVIWTRSELLVLNHVSADAQIAIYSIAFAIVAGLTRIPEAIARVTMPAVATLIGAGELHRVRAGYWRAMRLLLCLTPPVVAGAAVTGPALISLAYGDDFSGAGNVLIVLLGPLLVLPLITTSNALLFAFARLRFLLTMGILATVVDVDPRAPVDPALRRAGRGDRQRGGPVHGRHPQPLARGAPERSARHRMAAAAARAGARARRRRRRERHARRPRRRLGGHARRRARRFHAVRRAGARGSAVAVVRRGMARRGSRG